MMANISRLSEACVPHIFISYSHRDEQEKEALLTHLRVLQCDQHLEIWDDDRIQPGSPWKQDIVQAMTRAKVAILLITANFLRRTLFCRTKCPCSSNDANAQG